MRVSNLGIPLEGLPKQIDDSAARFVNSIKPVHLDKPLVSETEIQQIIAEAPVDSRMPAVSQAAVPAVSTPPASVPASVSPPAPPPEWRAPKPREQVVFNLEQFGTIRAYYHTVVRTDKVVALAYDTRYDQGVQYDPPNTPQPIQITINPSGGNKPESLQVIAAGIQFPYGSLMFTILIVHDESATNGAMTDDEMQLPHNEPTMLDRMAYGDRQPIMGPGDGEE